MAATRGRGIRFSRAALLPAAMTLAACGGPLSALDPAGPGADRIAAAWWVMLGGSALIMAFVIGLALYAFKPERRGRQVSERAMLWGGGLAFPVAVLTALLVYGLREGEALLPLPGAGSVYTVEATGSQWQWSFLHPDGTVLIDAVHIPAGEPVDIVVRSTDVIHSFWVPRLGGKIDAIPGRANVIRLRADAPGAYAGQCAEFCGLLHTDMRFTLEAHAPDALDAALAEAAGETGQ